MNQGFRGLEGAELVTCQPGGPEGGWRLSHGGGGQAQTEAWTQAVSGVSAVGRRVSWPVSSPGCRARQQCLLTAPGGRGACEGRPGRA